MNSPQLESKTPILDLSAPLPKKNQFTEPSWRRSPALMSALILGPFVIAAIFVLVGNRAATPFAESIGTVFDNFLRSFGPYGPLLIYAAFLIVLISSVVLHELGHLLAGKMVGFRFKSISVGPFLVSTVLGKVRIKVSRLTSFDGLTQMEIRTSRRLRKRLALYVAGGPMVTVISCLAVGLGLRTHLIEELPPPALSTARLFVGWSLLLLVLNLFPYLRRNGRFTDGARLLHFMTSRPRTRRLLSIDGLDLQYRSGVNLRLWKSTWIKAATCINDQSRDALSGFYLGYLWACSRSDETQASEFLERCLERICLADPEFSDTLIFEASVFQAWFRDNAEKATCWSRRLHKPSGVSLLLRIRAEIALRCAERKFVEAKAVWEKGLAFIKLLPSTPVQALLEESWLQWRQEIEARSSQLEHTRQELPVDPTTSTSGNGEQPSRSEASPKG